MLRIVPDKINLAEEELKIIEFWKKINAFKNGQELSKGKPIFSFYDGPPFATGLPHYGHILAGTIKDIVTRYAYQSGFHVDRRFGWDCHGLPVEYEIDKTNGFKGPEDIEKFGIKQYNKLCRDIVMKYSQQWEFIVNRIGRWIDFENDYKTMNPKFMESVWRIFSELWMKGLVYRGVKVMPYSTACCTPLSNFESGQNYKTVIDPSVVVKFRVVGEFETYLLAFTTTPWTLPSNLALCVNPNLVYVKIIETTKKYICILLENRLQNYLNMENEKCYNMGKEHFEIIDKCFGKDLAGLHYAPLFPYFQHLSNCFKVLTDNYVTSDSGTGIVHQAPYFGEDDFRICLAAGLITKDQEPICPINSTGLFTHPVSHFQGKYIKDADKDIIKHLKNEDKIFWVGTVSHNYPFCWRSDTPLIYRAIPSWFIRVQHMSEKLLAANHKTYWVPEFVKEKRFANWLRDSRDWAVSRNRFWGTPIPLWASEDYKEIICVGSIAELHRLSGVKVNDLHRESIDHITIPSANPNNPPLKRVPEVFDCWFESGSMPYAQLHYPFENLNMFNQHFPADFIAEGIDQTRGWFYTLLVISTALFNKAPFKNVIVNGLVLTADGQKMSKSKKNFPDPLEVINKYGADALRLYLINSPVVRSDNLRFREDGVRDVLKDVFLPWYNAYRFFVQNVNNTFNHESSKKFHFDEDTFTSTNLMDRWILSSLNSLNVFVIREMEFYRLYTVIPRLVKFIDDLTNWYVRLNRWRIKGDTDLDDWYSALGCLGSLLCGMVRLMAPFSPFITEMMYNNLNIITKRNEQSIHFVPMLKPRLSCIDKELEKAVSVMQTVIDLGRVIRDRKGIPNKCPLSSAVVILKNDEILKELQIFVKYISDELNIKKMILSTDKEAHGLSLKVVPDHKIIGPKFKTKAKIISQAIKLLSQDEIKELQDKGQILIDNEVITLNEVNITWDYTPQIDSNKEIYETNFGNDVLLLMDVTIDESNRTEGIAREVVSRIQKLRKSGGIVPSDKIIIYINSNSELLKIINEKHKFMENLLKAILIIGEPPKDCSEKFIISDVQKMKGIDNPTGLQISIFEYSSSTKRPKCRYITVIAKDADIEKSHRIGFVLLENPIGKNILSLANFKKKVYNLFNLNDDSVIINKNGEQLTEKNLLSNDNKIVLYANDNKSTVDDWLFEDVPIPVFINIKLKNENWATLILENPYGEILKSEELPAFWNETIFGEPLTEEIKNQILQCIV